MDTFFPKRKKEEYSKEFLRTSYTKGEKEERERIYKAIVWSIS
jgi:hypothetical protein